MYKISLKQLPYQISRMISGILSYSHSCITKRHRSQCEEAFHQRIITAMDRNILYVFKFMNYKKLYWAQPEDANASTHYFENW